MIEVLTAAGVAAASMAGCYWGASRDHRKVALKKLSSMAQMLGRWAPIAEAELTGGTEECPADVLAFLVAVREKASLGAITIKDVIELAKERDISHGDVQ